MGCSFDVFCARFNHKDDTKTFADLFNKMLKDDLYSDLFMLSEEDFRQLSHDNKYHLSISEEPLFRVMDNGDQLYPVILAHIEARPNESFSAEYRCTFNNCGAIVFTSYEYMNGELKVVSKYSEYPAPWCENCDENGEYSGWVYDEPLISIDEYEKDTVIECPNCGAVLEWDVTVYETILHMINGKLQ